MLKCSTSLWSADLANLESEIKRVEPYSERFHIDVADGNYVKSLLMFPDQVKACRPHTRLPFEVHLMCREPLDWVAPFFEAGADIIIFYYDSTPDPQRLIDLISSHDLKVGISLRIEEPVDLLEPYWAQLDVVTMLGTAVGIKGAEMDPSTPGRIRECRRIVEERGLKTLVEADGGIRRHTVPLIHEAGADYIVPGSLMFGENPKEMRSWLASL
jgi:ribulose-phosphate 3-epimerase